MSATLTTTQLRGALQAAGEFAELRELSEFPRHAIGALRKVIRCDHTGYNVIDLDSGRARVVAEPAEVVFDGGEKTLARLVHQNPMVVRVQQGDRAAMRLSDLITRRELHRTELYHEVYRLTSLEYQLAVQLPAPRRELGHPREIVAISLARTQRDFSESDRLLLELLTPHFTATLERLHEHALVRALTAGGGAHSRGHVVLIDPLDWTVAWVDSSLQGDLDLRVGAPVPAELRRQLGSERPVLAGHRFIARLVRDAYPGLVALRLIPERAPDAEQLRALGLTRRQADVHALAMQGLANRQIADALVLSTRTVEKHIEGIYDRLGASNRAEAILVTLAALGR